MPEVKNIEIPEPLNALVKEFNKLDFGEFNHVEIDLMDENKILAFKKQAEAPHSPPVHDSQIVDLCARPGETNVESRGEVQTAYLALFEKNTT